MTRRNRRHPEPENTPEQSSMRRPTIYMSPELERELEEQSTSEGTSKSRLITDLMELLLMTPEGHKLRQSALENQRTLAQELENYLLPFQEGFPTERIAQLARDSQRSSTQMTVYLVLLGLRVYERYLTRLQSAIDEEVDLIG